MKFLSVTFLTGCIFVLFAGLPAMGQLSPFIQGFDSVTAPAPQVANSDLNDDGWSVFGNAVNPDGTFAYQFEQAFPAPNVGEGAAFSSIATGEPTTSGINYLNIFSDYNNADHTNGTDRRITSFVFREGTVGAENVGETWTLSYDFRTAITPFGVADSEGRTTTAAYIVVLDSLNETFFEIGGPVETDTSAATTTFTPGSVSLLIEEAHVGQTLQYGFLNEASNEDPSGVYYDSLTFSSDAAVLGDFNGDGRVDCGDLDSFSGNIDVAADGSLSVLDLNGDNVVNDADVDLHIETLIVTQPNGVRGTFRGDFNCDGEVNVTADAFILVANLLTDVDSYSLGDANLDGTVNVTADAFALVANLGSSNSN